MILEALTETLTKYDLITAFAFVGALTWFSYVISDRFTAGRLHGSAIAITLGLVLAFLGGKLAGGSRGVADFSMLGGIALMGGGMLRDFAIVATAFGADLRTMKNAGLRGATSLIVGILLSFTVGAITAIMFGYTDAISVTTIGAGAVTYIVGPVTGEAIGASSDVMALSIAAGLVKSVLVMIGTPFVARFIGLTTPEAALVYGGLMGTTSGVAGGLAATDPKLVPYGAMTATFYTGLGCLLAPSLLFLVTRVLLG